MGTKPYIVRGRSKTLGFARVSLATFWTKAMDVPGNLAKHIEMAFAAEEAGAQICAFPELGISGYNCKQAFRDRMIQVASLEALRTFCVRTSSSRTVFVVGLPLALEKIFNVAGFVSHGKVIAIMPKSYLAARGEWQEGDYFSAARELSQTEIKLDWQEEMVPIGTDIRVQVLDENEQPQFVTAAEICEDGWQSNSPGDRHAHNGAHVIANLSASNWILGKDSWRRVTFPASSGRQKSVYLYATGADSTSSVVWDQHCMIIEDGAILGETKRWTVPQKDPPELLVRDVDIDRLIHDRQADGGWNAAAEANRYPYRDVVTHARGYVPNAKDFRRPLTRLPFVPADPAAMKRVGEELFNALTQGLLGRAIHVTGSIERPLDGYMGLSGGLDSALAFILCCVGYDRAGWSRTHMYAVRMPGPGSSRHTQNDSLRLAEAMGASIETVDITEMAATDLRATGHEPCWDCEKCENAQARVRTLVLKTFGFNWGTGDMDEGAKGWCTEGGDQSSMWHVIANMPKTLVRFLVLYFIEYLATPEERKSLRSILRTVISPELRKRKPGQKAQASEDKMGPYDLTGFFLYHILRTGGEPERIAFLAEVAFGRTERSVKDAIYDRRMILRWLRDFYVKFNWSQFKRQTAPDSSLTGSIGLGQHDKLRWPTDGSSVVWSNECDRLIAELGTA